MGMTEKDQHRDLGDRICEVGRDKASGKSQLG